MLLQGTCPISANKTCRKRGRERVVYKYVGICANGMSMCFVMRFQSFDLEMFHRFPVRCVPVKQDVEVTELSLFASGACLVKLPTWIVRE